MGIILNIQNKKWLRDSIVILTIILLLLAVIPGIYDIYQKKEGVVGYIEGHRIYKSAYDAKLKEVESGRNQSNEVIHQKTWETLTHNYVAKKICTDAGIIITDDQIAAEIRSYSTILQNVLKETDSPRYNNLEKEENPTKAFQKYIQTKDGKRWQQRYRIQTKVEEKLKYEIAAALLGFNSASKPTTIANPYQVSIAYTTVKPVDVPVEETPPTNAEIKARWQEEKSTKKAQTQYKVRFVVFNTAPSAIESADTKTKLQKLETPFGEVDNNLNFARKNTDNKENCEQKWAQNKTPDFIRQLNPGEVSDVIQKNPNTYVIYKVESTPNILFQLFGIGQVKAYAIEKNVNNDDILPYAKDQSEILKKRLDSYHPNNVMEDYGYRPEDETYEDTINTLILTEENTRTQGSQAPKYQIANHLFKENLRKGNTFIITNEKEKRTIVGYVAKKGKENQLAPQKVEVGRKTIVRKKQQALQQHLDQISNQTPKQVQEELQVAYGYLPTTTKEVDITKNNLGEAILPQEIIPLLNAEKGSYLVLHDEIHDTFIIAHVTSRETLDIPKEMSGQNLGDQTHLDEYIREKNHQNHNIQDNRYQSL